MGISSVFKNMFALTKARMKQLGKNTLPDVPDPGASGSGARVSSRTKTPGPAVRKYRRERDKMNKKAARSRRVNQARREGVSI